MDDSKKTPIDEGKKEDKVAKPNCTRCSGTSYSFRYQHIAGEEGLLVFCRDCGGIFSWSPKVK